MRGMRLLTAVCWLLLALVALSCGDAVSTPDQTSARGFTRVAAVQFEAPFLYQKGEEKAGPEVRLMERTLAKLNEERVAAGERPNEILWAKRDYAEMIPTVANGEVEYGAGLLIASEDRRQRVDFSDSYIQAELVLVTNPSAPEFAADDLAGKKIGIRGGSGVHSWVQANHADSETASFTSLNEALLALRRTEIDAVIDDRSMAAFSLDTVTGLGHLEIRPGILASLDVAVAVPKNNATLLGAVNAAIAEMKAENAFQAALSENLGDRVAKVENRYAARMERKRRATAPRSFVLGLTKAKESKFDIYKVANLNFVLKNAKTGRTHRTTRVAFRNKVGIASASLTPGTYALSLPKFGGGTIGQVIIRPQDGNRVNFTLRWEADDSVRLIPG